MSAAKRKVPKTHATPGPSDPTAASPVSADTDPDRAYARWREVRLRELDEDYAAWRATGHAQFPPDFDAWRRARRELIAEQLSAGRPLEAVNDDVADNQKLAL